MAEMIDLARIDTPAFLLNVPFSLSTAVPNNVWMEEMSAAERALDRPAALRQFLKLYGHLAGRAIVYLLPSQRGLQDQPYVSNLGAVLPHLAEPTFVASRFRSAVRVPEVPLGLEFLSLMGYQVHTAPEFFEGEADLKHLHGNVYVGAHGIRTSAKGLSWLERTFGMEVIRFAMADPYLYHLDCCLLPLSADCILLCTEVASDDAIRALERHAEIIDVALDDAYSGITNSLLLHGTLLCATNPEYLVKGHPYYEYEKGKIAALERICAVRGLVPLLFDLSEFYKSGALLSCLVMHLNRANCRR